MSDYHLVHEAETVSDMMVKQGKATPEEGEWLKDYAIYGIFPYAVAKFQGSAMRRVESCFQHLLIGQRMRRFHV